MNQKIGIIGAGNMGGTFFKGLLKSFDQDNLFVCDKNREKLEALEAKNSSIDPNKVLKEANVVILAIKPQSFNELMDEVTVSLNYKLLISIMAGISLEKLEEATDATRIIRAMPNLPVQVGKGVIGWVATEATEDSDVQLAKKIFSALGDEIQVSHESMLDAITVLSGCGPAYFFFLSEFLIDKARLLGFTDKEANEIAEKTFIGSAELLKKGNKTAKEWRQAVTSKGGVTEAVLDHLIEEEVPQIFDQAIDEGLRRSKELNQ